MLDGLGIVILAIGYGTFTTAVTLGAIYVLITVGLNMVYGMLNILHIAHAAVLVLGGYTAYLTWTATESFWFGLGVALVVGGLANVMMYVAVYRWMADEDPLIPLIASIGIFVALSDGYRLIFGPYSKGFSPDFENIPAIAGFSIDQVIVIVTTTVLLYALFLIVTRTRVGLAWQVSAQDREMAGVLGINIRRVTALNFLVGGAMAGAAGALVGMYYGSVSPYMGNVYAYKAFIIIVIGGLGSIPGTLLASLLLGIFESVMIAQFGYLLPRDALAFTLMILMLMFRPKGIYGTTQFSIRELTASLRKAMLSNDRSKEDG